MAGDYIALLVILAAAVLCPLAAHVIPRKVVPEAVLLLLAGAIIGPNMLGLVQDNEVIRFFSQLGLGFQFLLAGYEIDPARLRGGKGRKGLATWAVTFAFALLVTHFIVDIDIDDNQLAFLAVAIAMTSTAFGTVTSILKERKLEGTQLADATLTYGVWGQLGPVVAIALLLSSRQPWQTAIVLVALVAISFLIGFTAKRVRKSKTKLRSAIKAKGRASTQMFVRMILLLLVALVAFAANFGLNIMLGAFAAGFIMRHVLPKGHKRTETKLHGIGYGFFIPIFFVESGTKIDLVAIGLNPVLLVTCVVALVLVRAVPVFLAQSIGRNHRLKRLRDRAAVSAYCTTALSIIVAVTSIAVEAGALGQDTASVMVAAAAVSVLVMPLAAQLLHGPGRNSKGQLPCCAQ